jgi:WD40 repeat protein
MRLDRSPLDRIKDHGVDDSFQTLRGHSEGIRRMDLDTQQGLLATCSYDGAVSIWETHAGKCLQEIQAHAGRAETVDLSPDGSRLLTCGRDAIIRLWDVRTGNTVSELPARCGFHFGRFSHDGQLVAVATCLTPRNGHTPGELTLYDMNSNKRRWRVFGNGTTLPSFSPDGSSIITIERLSGCSSLVSCRSVATGQEVTRLPRYLGFIASHAFSPDGQLFVLGGTDPDRPIEIWDVDSLQRVRVIHGHTNDVTAVAISPDGGVLASGSEDQTIRLWDLHTGQARTVLRGHIDGITSLVFTVDGKTLISGSRDHTVKFWNVAEWR